MTNTTDNRSKDIQTSHIKDLVQRQGKSTVGDTSIQLKSPAFNDPHLQTIINDPTVSIKPVGKQTPEGNSEYELSANGKSVKVKISCTNCK